MATATPADADTIDSRALTAFDGPVNVIEIRRNRRADAIAAPWPCSFISFWSSDARAVCVCVYRRLVSVDCEKTALRHALSCWLFVALTRRPSIALVAHTSCSISPGAYDGALAVKQARRAARPAMIAAPGRTHTSTHQYFADDSMGKHCEIRANAFFKRGKSVFYSALAFFIRFCFPFFHRVVSSMPLSSFERKNEILFRLPLTARIPPRHTCAGDRRTSGYPLAMRITFLQFMKYRVARFQSTGNRMPFVVHFLMPASTLLTHSDISKQIGAAGWCKYERTASDWPNTAFFTSPLSVFRCNRERFGHEI